MGLSRQHINPCAGEAEERRVGSAGKLGKFHGWSGQCQLGILTALGVLGSTHCVWTQEEQQTSAQVGQEV